MEEINLKEIIEVIVKGKRIISIITVVCVIFSIVVSIFFVKPVYEAQTMLMISPINSELESKDNNSFTDLVGTLSQYPQMTIDTYREQVKAPVILQYIRENLFSEDTPLSSIASKISVNALNKTNLLTISVKDNNSENAANIANLVSQRLTGFVSETNKRQAENSAQFVEEQMEKEKEDMNIASDKLKEFLSQPRGPQELKMELESKLTQLTDFKTKIAQMKVDEETCKASLDHTKELLKNTPRLFITNKTIVNDKILGDIIKEKTNLNTGDIAEIRLSDEQINSIYVDLTAKVNEFEIQYLSLISTRKNTEKEIGLRQNEIEILQSELAQKQQEFDMLNHEVQLIKQTYDAYQQKYKELMIKQSAEIGESSIVVVSEAIPPIKPIGPNRLLNLAIALVLGLGIGFAVVFFKEYLSEGTIKKNGLNL